MSPASMRTHLVPDYEECVMNLEALANNKAAGPSGLPKELYSRSTHAREALIKLVQAMFENRHYHARLFFNSGFSAQLLGTVQ